MSPLRTSMISLISESVSIWPGGQVSTSAWLQAGCSASYGVSVASGDVVAPGTALQARY